MFCFRSFSCFLLMCMAWMCTHEVWGARRRVPKKMQSGVVVSTAKKTSRPAAPLYAAMVMDAQTGGILFQDHAFELRIPASLTKVMTAYVAFQEIRRGRLKLEDRVVFSRFAASREPTKFGLKPGRSLSVKEAIMVMLVKSCNDAAEALGEKIGGSTATFARMMTLEARHMGLKHTYFYNASGLPHPLQKTTAYDMGLLGRAILRDFPRYASWFQVKEYTCQGKSLRNTNKLLGPLAGYPKVMIDGLKTGKTLASGSNMIVSARSQTQRWMVVVMGLPNRHVRDQRVVDLLRRVLSSEHVAPKGPPLHHVQASAEKMETIPSPATQVFTPAHWGLQMGVFRDQKRARMHAQQAQKWAKDQGLRLQTQCLLVRTRNGIRTKVFLWGLTQKDAQNFLSLVQKKGLHAVVVRQKKPSHASSRST